MVQRKKRDERPKLLAVVPSNVIIKEVLEVESGNGVTFRWSAETASKLLASNLRVFVVLSQPLPRVFILPTIMLVTHGTREIFSTTPKQIH